MRTLFRDRGLFALTTLILTGCPSYTFVEIVPEKVTEENLKLEIGDPIPADILFVVDNSGSMADEQENLARNFDAFINVISAGNGDYRIAVVSTDLDPGGGTEAAGDVSTAFKTTAPNALISNTRDGCMAVDIQHGCFRGPDAAKRVITSDMEPADQVSTFQQNVRVGSCGSGAEQGLAAMIRGLQNAQNGCNQGFLRDNANLVIVIVSDENDCSNAVGSTCPGVDVNAIASQLEGIKPASRIRFAAIVGAKDGQAQRCRIDPITGGPAATCGDTCTQFSPQGSMNACTPGPNACPQGEICSNNVCVNQDYAFWDFCYWCSFYDTDSCCSALGGNDYLNFARALETRIVAADGELTQTGCQPGQGDERIGCLVDSICQAEFAETLQKIATDLVIVNEVPLAPCAAYPPGVKVTKNGAELVNGTDYTVSEDGCKIAFKGANAPNQGDEVEVFLVIDNP